MKNEPNKDSLLGAFFERKLCCRFLMSGKEIRNLSLSSILFALKVNLHYNYTPCHSRKNAFFLNKYDTQGVLYCYILLMIGKKAQSKVKSNVFKQTLLSSTIKSCIKCNKIRSVKFTKFSLAYYLLCQCEHCALRQSTAERRQVKNLIHLISVYLAITSWCITNLILQALQEFKYWKTSKTLLYGP